MHRSIALTVFAVCLICGAALAADVIIACQPGYEAGDTLTICNARLTPAPTAQPTADNYVKCQSLVLPTRTPAPNGECAATDGYIRVPDEIDGPGVARQYRAWTTSRDGITSDASNIIQPTPHPMTAPALLP